MIARSDGTGGTENSSPQESGRMGGDTRIRVWLVDDNPSYRTLMSELLNLEGGLECTRQFVSAEAVIDALTHETAPDAILLDIDMGGMSGLDALRPIKDLAHFTPVLMLTAFFDSDRRSRALRDGASDFLLKRFSVEEISERVRDACRQPTALPSDREPATVLDGRFRNFSDWPERRAPGTMGQRHRGDDISEAPTGRGRSNVHSRSVAHGLARGVRYLRTLMGGIF